MFDRLVLYSCWSTALVLCGSLASANETFTLGNGLRVRLVLERDPGNVCVLLAVRAGMLHEGKGEPHLAHVTEHATVYDLGEVSLAETVQQWFGQGKANAETLGELMYFDLHCTRDDLPTGLAIQASRLASMKYSTTTLGREIPRALAEVDNLSRQPGGMGKFALVPFVQAALYGETVVRLRQQTEKISIENVRAFHDRAFGAQSATVVVVGDFDAPQARKEIEQRFGTLPKAKNEAPTRPVLKPGKRRVQWDVAKRHGFVAWQTPKATEADYPAIWLAARLLQNRLFAAAAHAGTTGQIQVNTDLDQMLLVGCEVKDEDGFDSLKKTFVSQVERLSQSGGIDRAALNLCCDQFDGFQKTNLDRTPLPPGITRTMARTNIELQRLMVEAIAGDWEPFLTKLRAVPADLVASAARKWLSADRACFVEVVPEGN